MTESPCRKKIRVRSCRKGEPMITAVNLTPLVDVTLVVLGIFMVTTTFITLGSVKLKLPEASTAEEPARSPLVLALDKDGNYLVDGSLSTTEGVANAVRTAVAANPNVEAVITADRVVEYGRVMTLIDLARMNGIRNFAAAVERRRNQ